MAPFATRIRKPQAASPPFLSRKAAHPSTSASTVAAAMVAAAAAAASTTAAARAEAKEASRAWQQVRRRVPRARRPPRTRRGATATATTYGADDRQSSSREGGLQPAECRLRTSRILRPLCWGGAFRPTGIGRNRRPAACRLHIATTKKPNAWWFSGTHSRIPPRDSSGLRCRNERHSACTRQTEPAALILAHSASTTNPHLHTSSPCRVPLTLQFSDSLCIL